MDDRAAPLVEKRDGRVEALRATKFARSIGLALQDAGLPDQGDSLELAARVLARLRQRSPEAFLGAGRALRSADIAVAVQQVLLARGLGGVARLYGHVSDSRRQRHCLAAADPQPADSFLPAAPSRQRSWTKETTARPEWVAMGWRPRSAALGRAPQ